MMDRRVAPLLDRRVAPLLDRRVAPLLDRRVAPLLDRRTLLAALPLFAIAGCGTHASALRRVSARGDEELLTEHGSVPITTLDPQLGPRSARVVMVLFSDFQCPFCRQMADVTARLRAALPNQFRLVFKHLPVPIHAHARSAAVAAQIVFLEAGTDAFWRMHDRLFAHSSEISATTLTRWALDEGVPLAGIERRSHDAEAKVDADLRLARMLGVDGAPFALINQRRVSGAYPYEQIRAWVDEQSG